MELEARDGQLCIVKSNGRDFHVSECARLATIANTLGRDELDRFSSITSLTRAIRNRYRDLPEFELHVLGFSGKDKVQLEKMREKMANMIEIRYVERPRR